MYKKTLLTAVIAAAALPVAAQTAFSVNGTYSGNGKKVYLRDQLTGKSIDSTTVADGRFAFSGSAAADALLAVKAEGQDWETEFFNDGTPISVCVNDSTLKGSPQNERLTQLKIEQEKPRRLFNAKTEHMTQEEIMANREALADEMNKMIDGQIALADRVIADEGQSLIPVAFVGYYFIDNGTEAYDEIVEKYAWAKHPYVKKVRDNVEKMMPPKDSAKTAFIGQTYTDLEMAAPDGTLHKISEKVGQGRWVLVDFWASWCGPCRAEMPNVVEAYNKYHAKGFEVIGVSFDQKKGAWERAISQLELPWLQISDLKGWGCAAAPAYKVDAIPDNILISPEGKIVARSLRGRQLHKRLEKIFGN